jgi:hypothetical protein
MMKRVLLVAVIGLVAVFAFAGIYDAMKDGPSSATGHAASGATTPEREVVAARPPPPGGPAVEIHTDEPARIDVGAVTLLDEPRHVTVLNPGPIDDGVWRFPPGSTCFAAGGGGLTVVALTDASVLLRYRRPPRAEIIDLKTRLELAARQDEPDPDSQTCPDGTVFFVQRDDYAGMGEAADDSELEEARGLLESAAPRVDKRKKK